MSNLQDLINQVNNQTNRLRFFTKSIPDLYKTIATIELHNSNHIEGNTLTYSDTVALLNGELAQVEKSQEQDVQEVLGYRNASEFMVQSLYEYYYKPYRLTVDFICSLHYYLMIDINSNYAGRLRQYPEDKVYISGAKITPLDGGSVPEFLEELVEWYNDSVLPPLEKIAILKTDFIYCHPFFDGNGRISRLLMNMELMKHGYYPNIIRAKDKQAYCSSLENAILYHNHDYFIEFFLIHYLQELESYEQIKYLI